MLRKILSIWYCIPLCWLFFGVVNSWVHLFVLTLCVCMAISGLFIDPYDIMNTPPICRRSWFRFQALSAIPLFILFCGFDLLIGWWIYIPVSLLLGAKLCYGLFSSVYIWCIIIPTDFLLGENRTPSDSKKIEIIGMDLPTFIIFLVVVVGFVIYISLK